MLTSAVFRKLDYDCDGRISKFENRKNVFDFFTGTAIDPAETASLLLAHDLRIRFVDCTQ